MDYVSLFLLSFMGFLLGDSTLLSQKQFTEVRVTAVIDSLLLLARILICFFFLPYELESVLNAVRHVY